MLSVAPGVKIFLYAQAADLRRGYDGLASLVQEAMGEDPLSGSLFLFLNKRANRLKLFYWDRDGYAIWMKRLQSGSFELPARHTECEKIAARAASDNVDHLGFLLQLTELELIERERKSAERRLKAARFPAHKTLDEFDFQARPSVNKPLVWQLIQGDYLEQRENILLVGPSGTGKTHLATSLGIAACGQGKRVRFFRVTELITLLLEAKEERQLLRLRQQLAKLELLVLDELGYVPASKAGAELLFDVIATAYERHSIIMTTNLPFENWSEVLGSERLTGAALDRLTHRCHILETTGESYRLQDAKRRRRRIN